MTTDDELKFEIKLIIDERLNRFEESISNKLREVSDTIRGITNDLKNRK